MALKGTDIVKKLPESGKKNCRECGFPTCFAFAMKLAGGGVKLEKCPHLTEEVKAELEDALAPPIKLVTLGTGDNVLKIGNEEVIYRHEKTFVHSPGVAVLLSDTEPEEKVDKKIKKLQDLRYQWVGVELKADLLALNCQSGDKAKFAALANKVHASNGFAVILISEDVEALVAAGKIYADRRPLLYPVTEQNIERIITEFKDSPLPVCVRSDNVEGIVPLTTKLKEAGFEEIVLDPGSRKLQDAVRDQMLIRRASLKQNFRPLGYPTIGFPCFMAEDSMHELLYAAMFMIKYPGVIVLSDIAENTLLPLLVQRLNIYTDPRIPMSVEEKLYDINNPDADSPVLVTSNWALTYFIVASEIEGSKVPTWLVVKESEGLGVLTGWAAGKFTADSIAPRGKKTGS
jgi:acetyl-CoA decarbonylase/synthase complex subunit gamma